MKKNLRWLGLGGLVAASLMLVMSVQAKDSSRLSFIREAHAEDLFMSCMENVKKDCQSWASSGGGSEIPRGLRSDSKAELAMGEKYILTGIVTFDAGLPYLRISFKKHPWLASTVRKRNPFYRIDGNVNEWRRYAGKEMTIVATARYTAFKDSLGRSMLEIYLEPSAEAVIEAIQPVQYR